MAKANILIRIVSNYSDFYIRAEFYNELEYIIENVGKEIVKFKDSILNLEEVGLVFVEKIGKEQSPWVKVMSIRLKSNKEILIPFQGKQYFNRAKETIPELLINQKKIRFNQTRLLSGYLDLNKLDWEKIEFKELEYGTRR